MTNMDDIKIDSEFRALVPPLVGEEYRQLEENIVAEGCRDALVTWNGILLDGHHRLEICRRREIEFNVVEIELPDRNEAMAWIIHNQLGRRNLPPFARAELALKLEPLIANKAKEKQREHGSTAPGRNKALPKNSWEVIDRNASTEKAKIWSDASLSYDAKIRRIDDIQLEAGKAHRRLSLAAENRIYLAKSGDRLKIGVSSAPEARIEQLRVGCPDITLLATFDGGKHLESKLHKKFATRSVAGEWFAYSEQIVRDMERYVNRESTRADETTTQVAEAANVSHDTIFKAKVITEKAPEPVKESLRKGDTSINAVYAEIMQQEKEEKREARREENREKVRKAPDPLKAGAKFATIVIDPPWDWGDEGDVDQMGRARPTYATMPYAEIEKLPVGGLADEDCHLYLWITNRSLPKGFKLLEAWGFRYVTALTWCKPSIGMGNYFRGSTEHVLFAVKGSQPLRRKDVGTWFQAPRGKEHSAKPDTFYALIESCSPGPYLEMFARNTREGWIIWGAEAQDERENLQVR